MLSTLVGLVLVVLLAVVLIMFFAPKTFDGLFYRVKGKAAELEHLANDAVATANGKIAQAKENVAQFESKVTRLLTKIKQNEGDLPELKDELKKWENIYVQAKSAGVEEDASRAAAQLKRAKERHDAVAAAITQDRKLMTNLQDQIQACKNAIADGEVKKERLMARHASAELRKEAMAGGKLALSGLDGLSDLERAVEEVEAQAAATEEMSAGDSDLETKYVKDDEHEAYLASLLNKG